MGLFFWTSVFLLCVNTAHTPGEIVRRDGWSVGLGQRPGMDFVCLSPSYPLPLHSAFTGRLALSIFHSAFPRMHTTTTSGDCWKLPHMPPFPPFLALFALTRRFDFWQTEAALFLPGPSPFGATGLSPASEEAKFHPKPKTPRGIYPVWVMHHISSFWTRGEDEGIFPYPMAKGHTGLVTCPSGCVRGGVNDNKEGE